MAASNTAKKCTPPPLIGNKWSKGSKRPYDRPSAFVHCVCHCSHITVKMKSPNVSNCDLGIEPKMNGQMNGRIRIAVVRAKKDVLPSSLLVQTWLNKQRKSTSSRSRGQSAKLDWLKTAAGLAVTDFYAHIPLCLAFSSPPEEE